MKYKPKKATALRYDKNHDQAPKVTATGKGLVAENILQKARDNHVPIQEDATMAEFLGELNINETIPEELYQAVAEVFAFIYRADQKMTEK